MPTLAIELRNKLERVVIEARDAAEAGARAALQALAVHHHEPYPHMKPRERELRNHLRARARQLGDRRLPKPDSSGKDHEIDHLAHECAYEHWHRMLFARFLAENNLLIEPCEKMAISLAEAEELAKEEGVDVWGFASRCAQVMLPQIFRPDDPLLQVSFATEHMLKLERLLASLPQAVFTASDALGWVYQFWQSKKKDEVNRSEVKIGADEIAAVTQLFTEPYMVSFLLHNTLGAWWAGRKLADADAKNARTEDELRRKLALPGVGWEYLRFVRGADGKGGPWRPAAGTFDGWPKTGGELKVLDPCCGSGHFLVAALHHLVPIRMAEEGLSAPEAVDAVLRDNVHGLEIDERCCQIAAFALAFAAWTYPGAGGYRPLPDLNIACTGIGPQATKAQWLDLAEKAAAKGNLPARHDLFRKEESLLSSAIASALEELYDLFTQAPTLGSLIDPRRLSVDLYRAGYEALVPLLSGVFKGETDDETRELAITAAGMVKAANLLAGEYTIVVTNVPYLGRGKQDSVLRDFCGHRYPDAKADLGICFVERSLAFCLTAGTSALVTPQNYLFYDGYRRLRLRLLKHAEWGVVATLGPKGFSTAMWDLNIVLSTITRCSPSAEHGISGIDVSEYRTPRDKDGSLRTCAVTVLRQGAQLSKPDCRITFATNCVSSLLGEFVELGKGSVTGDGAHHLRCFWEFPHVTKDLRAWLNTPKGDDRFSGRERLVLWKNDGEDVRRELGAWLRGDNVFGKHGILINKTTFDWAFYTGEMFDDNTGVLMPRRSSDLPAIATFVGDPCFDTSVRAVDQALKVTIGSFGEVAFDLRRWHPRAAEEYPNGLPEPESDDPTQWLFHGRPEESTKPLQVALARLLGYRWPAELDDTMRLSNRARTLVKRCGELAKFGDEDGIVCIPSVRGEEPASERLEALVTAAGVKPAKVRELVGGTDLEDWLRNGFFEEHCKLLQHRPFVWHIWDGRKRDGFGALVNYHKLAEGGGKGRKLLESLTYSYLGDWITRQKDEVKRGEGGAEDRLAAALELQKRLQAILEGEPPFEIFVRWKPLAKQPIGWEPDINDGVRVNIRPFLASDLPGGRTGAGVLRYKPNIKWTKDRGKEPQRPKAEYPWFWSWDEKTQDFMGGNKFDGNRWNACHYTNKAKQAARDAVKIKEGKNAYP